jgi:hypothetical protein
LKETEFGDVAVDVRTILKQVLEELTVRVWNGFKLFRIGYNGEDL